MFTRQTCRRDCAVTVLAVMTAVAPRLGCAKSASDAESAVSVLASCVLVGSEIVFGGYASTQLDQAGNISVICTSGTSYSVALDAGTGTGATTAVRRLTGSQGGSLNYALYRDAGRISNWGGTVEDDTQSGVGNGRVQNLPVYGRIPAGQAPQSGSYTDTVTITLTY